MKSVTVDEMPKLWATVLAWLKAGESVEVRDHEKRVATMQPEDAIVERETDRGRNRQWAEELAARQTEIYGSRMLTPEESAFIRDRGEW